jgi:hypothetical protein
MNASVANVPSRPYALAATLTVAWCGFSAAETPEPLTLVPQTSGPVSVADLQVLLGRDVQYQMFDFESQEPFCLRMGYVHEVDGSRVAGADNGAICNRAGEHRLIVTMRWPASERPELAFGLSARDTGMGGSFSYGALDIPAENRNAWTQFRPEETLMPDADVTLLRWSYGRVNQPSRHDVLVTVRLVENPDGAVHSGAPP